MPEAESNLSACRPKCKPSSCLSAASSYEQGQGAPWQPQAEEGVELAEISWFLQGCGIVCDLLRQPGSVAFGASAAHVLVPAPLGWDMLRVGHPGGERGVFVGSR